FRIKGETVISAQEAFRMVMNRALSRKTIAIKLEDSLGRILAEDVYADLDQPPFDRVAMDGIVINSELLKTTTKFKILQTLAAGSVVPALPEGALCFEIMTGASLPDGANMVIRYEDVKIDKGI